MLDQKLLFAKTDSIVEIDVLGTFVDRQEHFLNQESLNLAVSKLYHIPSKVIFPHVPIVMLTPGPRENPYTVIGKYVLGLVIDIKA